ncbi:MAG: hypothetical protein ACHQAX_05190 [Gammaproteobacteria bacterium]
MKSLQKLIDSFASPGASTDPLYKKELADEWIAYYPTNVNDIIKIIEHFDSDNHKYDLIAQWTTIRSIKPTTALVSALLPCLKNSWWRYKLIKDWATIQKEPFDTDFLLMIVTDAQDDSIKQIIINDWVNLNPSVCDAKTLATILSHINELLYKILIINERLKNITDENARLLYFVSCAKLELMGNLYDYKTIYFQLRHSNFNFENIPELIKGLYPESEFAQIDFIKFVISHAALTSQQIQDTIKKVATSLDGDDYCLELLESGKKHGMDPKDVMLIVKDRLSSKFESLADLLKDQTESVLTEEGLTELKNLLGDSIATLPLSAVFSYYDIMGQLNEFTCFIEKYGKNNLAENIKHKYAPPKNTPFIIRAENLKLVKLGIKPLPGTLDLCHYLQQRIPEIPAIEKSIEALHASTGESPMEAKYKTNLKNLLTTLASLGQPQRTESILTFFESVISLPLAHEKKKLHDLFMGKMKELVFLFSKPNGIVDYIEILRDISEGCVANIGMKTSMYLYAKLLKEPEDQILYPFFCEQIAIPFLNRGKDKLGISVATEDADVLRNTHLLTTHLCPQGFVNRLSMAFYAGGEMRQNPTPILTKFLTTHELAQFNNNVFDAFENLPQEQSQAASLQKQAEMASFLILRQAMPPLFVNEHAIPVKEEYMSWVSDKPTHNHGMKL